MSITKNLYVTGDLDISGTNANFNSAINNFTGRIVLGSNNVDERGNGINIINNIIPFNKTNFTKTSLNTFTMNPVVNYPAGCSIYMVNDNDVLINKVLSTAGDVVTVENDININSGVSLSQPNIINFITSTQFVLDYDYPFSSGDIINIIGEPCSLNRGLFIIENYDQGNKTVSIINDVNINPILFIPYNNVTNCIVNKIKMSSLINSNDSWNTSVINGNISNTTLKQLAFRSNIYTVTSDITMNSEFILYDTIIATDNSDITIILNSDIGYKYTFINNTNNKNLYIKPLATFTIVNVYNFNKPLLISTGLSISLILYNSTWFII